MNCAHPIDAATLADYWLAALREAEEQAIEEHLLGCDGCGERLREVIALAQGVRQLACEGSLRIVVSEVFLKRAAEQGLRIRQYAPPPSGSVECTVTAEDDLLVGHLVANLSGVQRVDLSICDESGIEQFRFPDIPFGSRAGVVVFQESITLAKAAPSNTMIVRLVSVEKSGRERPLGAYTFHHTRSLPGPGGV